MKEVKVQKDNVVKTIDESHLSTYLAMGWEKVEEVNYFSSQFAKIK